MWNSKILKDEMLTSIHLAYLNLDLESQMSWGNASSQFSYFFP